MGSTPENDSFRIALHTISDTRSPDNDESGNLMKDLFQEQGHEIRVRKIVREDTDELREAFREAIEDPEVDVLVTSGGTGISHRDRTLEVLRPLLDRELPGFGELFRRLSYDQIGPYTVMSRATAGRAGTTVIFSLPGSPKAVRLALEEIVLEILSHAVREAIKHAPSSENSPS